jgi:hypothetical protein
MFVYFILYLIFKKNSYGKMLPFSPTVLAISSCDKYKNTRNSKILKQELVWEQESGGNY